MKTIKNIAKQFGLQKYFKNFDGFNDYLGAGKKVAIYRGVAGEWTINTGNEEFETNKETAANFSAALQKEGIRVLGYIDAREYDKNFELKRHLKIQHKKIVCKRYKIIYSNALNNKLKSVSLKDEELDALKDIENKLINAKNISSYLSSRSNIPSYLDVYRTAFHIYHTHLNKDKLLFLICDDKNNIIYFVDIADHGAFKNLNVVRTAHRYFPEYFLQFELEFIKPPEEKISDEEIINMCYKKCSPIYEVDGKCYATPIASDGTPAEVLSDYDWFLDFFKWNNP